MGVFSNKFFKKVKEENEAGGTLESFLPFVSVKFRDSKCCFKGVSYDVDDMTKFVVKDGVYTPYIFADKQQCADGRVIDMFPFLCVGIVEILAMYQEYYRGVFTDFSKSYEFGNYIECKTVDGWNDFFTELFYEGKRLLTDVFLSMRREYVCEGKASVNQVSCMLFLQGLLSKRYFCEVLLDVMTFSGFFITAFLREDLSTVGVVDIGADCKGVSSSCIFDKQALKRKVVRYKVPDSSSENKISDGRGISISLFCILATGIFSRFGEYGGKEFNAGIYDNPDEIIGYQNRVIVDCIGNDVTGYYVRRGMLKEDWKAHSVFDNYMAYIDEQFNYNGSIYAREVYEEDILARKGYHLKFKPGLVLRNISMHYTSEYLMTTTMGALSLMYRVDASEVKEKYEKEITTLKKQGSAKASELNLRISRLEDKIKSLELENAELLQNKDLLEAKKILDSKNKTIEKLLGENKVLNQRIRGMYVESDIDDEVAVDVPLDTVVDFVNGFKVVVIGGRDNLLQRAKDIGLREVYQINAISEIRGTVLNADFLVIATSFVSHKFVFGVKERFKSLYDEGRVLYFNGSNVEGLAKVCYDYISSWIGG